MSRRATQKSSTVISVLVSRLILPEYNKSAQRSVGGGIVLEREKEAGRGIVRLASRHG